MHEITPGADRSPAAPARTAAVDASPNVRPGVPREAQPRPDDGAHWMRPSRQQPTVRVFPRKGLMELTPVFGTAQPPHGLSGVLRRIAYLAPEHRARHWAGLMLADRVDIIETRVGRALGRPLRENGFIGAANFLERNALAVVAAGGILVWTLVRTPASQLRKFGGRARGRSREAGPDATDRDRELGGELRRRGRDLGLEAGRRGWDLGLEVGRRGRDLGLEAGRRGRDLGLEAGRRGRDLVGGVRRQGQQVARKGFELGEELGRRGQELVSDIAVHTRLRRRRRWYHRLGS